MDIILIAVAILILAVLAGLWFAVKPRYDHRGFDRSGIHRNGTRYDDEGYDIRGYDAEGFDRRGYDAHGYDRDGYDSRGFDRKRLHRNGTRFDDTGFDFRGLDAGGFDRRGYDLRGYDRRGFDRTGYDRHGKNAQGQYDRLHDPEASADGFLDLRLYPIGVTTHARQRIAERLPARVSGNADALAQEAYRHGRSKRQIKKSSAALIEEIEARYENSVVLIHRGYIYIFSEENTLITVYKNDRIPL